MKMLKKYTHALRYTVSLKMLRRLRHEAEVAGLKPALVIEFSGHMYYPAEKWALVPYDDAFKASLPTQGSH